MDIQTELQKIHHKFGVSEKANYEIQKLFDEAIIEAKRQALILPAVIRQSEQLVCQDASHKGAHSTTGFCSICQSVCYLP